MKMLLLLIIYLYEIEYIPVRSGEFFISFHFQQFSLQL